MTRMSKASDLLRERATIAAIGGRPHDSAIISAVADLLDDLYTGEPFACAMCKQEDQHRPWCRVAALERAVRGDHGKSE